MSDDPDQRHAVAAVVSDRDDRPGADDLGQAVVQKLRVASAAAWSARS
ncbi:MAG TPA: hypothetical protein VKG38_06760 [Solirubrobacteraceae bacterium]|nr:hypothetical protein [Solirubrobacteraceae bacterium]